MGKKSKSVLGDRVEKVEVLTVLLAQAVGSDGSALQAWTIKALEKKRDGDGTLFQQLLEAIDRNTEIAELTALVTSLSTCTASLHKKRHGDLTSLVLQRCFRADENLSAAVEAFAVNCVSVNADLLDSILHELVKNFLRFDLLAATPPETEQEVAARAARGAHTSHTSEDAKQEAQNARDVHRVVQRVLETFPTGTMSFLEQLSQAFPHRVRRLPEQCAYLSNILHVTTYQPQLLPAVLDNVTERLIKIDVEVDPQKLHALQSGAIDVADDGELFGLEMEETSEERLKMLENAEKLDAMMLIAMRFFRAVLGERTSAVSRERKDLAFKALLASFHAKILTTFRSKYAQFLVFYACHFQNQHGKDLLGHLITKIIDKEVPDSIRHAAGSYLGSFLARAKYLRLQNIETALRLLVTWILEYMDKECPNVQGPDPRHHSLFYCLVQSLFYVLCFRLPQLMGAENGKFETFLRFELRLHDIIVCSLNPLKVIDEAVGVKFVGLSVKYKLIDTQVLRSLTEYNKTVLVHGTSEWEEECSFFPFDSYNLPLSRYLIEGPPSNLYQVWVETCDDIFSEDEERPAGWIRDGEGSEGADESIAMSLTSQLSLSDRGTHNSGDASPSASWRPMSFSPSGADMANPLHHQRGMR